MRTAARVARTNRRCGSCLASIKPGAKYLEHVASPNHSDLGNPAWMRTAECAGCAERYGRGELLAPVAGVVR